MHPITQLSTTTGPSLDRKPELTESGAAFDFDRAWDSGPGNAQMMGRLSEIQRPLSQGAAGTASALASTMLAPSIMLQEHANGDMVAVEVSALKEAFPTGELAAELGDADLRVPHDGALVLVDPEEASLEVSAVSAVPPNGRGGLRIEAELDRHTGRFPADTNALQLMMPERPSVEVLALPADTESRSMDPVGLDFGEDIPAAPPNVLGKAIAEGASSAELQSSALDALESQASPQKVVNAEASLLTPLRPSETTQETGLSLGHENSAKPLGSSAQTSSEPSATRGALGEVRAEPAESRGRPENRQNTQAQPVQMSPELAEIAGGSSSASVLAASSPDDPSVVSHLLDRNVGSQNPAALASGALFSEAAFPATPTRANSTSEIPSQAAEPNQPSNAVSDQAVVRSAEIGAIEAGAQDRGNIRDLAGPMATERGPQAGQAVAAQPGPPTTDPRTRLTGSSSQPNSLDSISNLQPSGTMSDQVAKVETSRNDQFEHPLRDRPAQVAQSPNAQTVTTPAPAIAAGPPLAESRQPIAEFTTGEIEVDVSTPAAQPRQTFEASPAPVRQTNVTAVQANQALNTVMQAVTDRKFPIEIALDPPELGSVRISILNSESAVSFVVHTDRPETADLMRRHVSMLQDALAERSGTQVNVSFSDAGGDASARREAQSTQPGQLLDGAELDQQDVSVLDVTSAQPANAAGPGRLDLKL